MSAQHTPGPWADNGGTLYARIVPERRLPKRVGIAQQTHMSIATVSNSPEPHMLPGEPEANARLIAAAPDLLAALKRIITACDHGSATLADSELNAVFAAIAKCEAK